MIMLYLRNSDNLKTIKCIVTVNKYSMNNNMMMKFVAISLQIYKDFVTKLVEQMS